MAAVFILVPLSLEFLSKEEYGIWLTLSSFIGWFSFFDVGLGQGLRNKFAEAKARENLGDLRNYVSTAYYTITVVSVILFILFLLVSVNVSWAGVFGLSLKYESDLQVLMPFLFGFFCLQLILRLISSVYLADQKASIPSALNFYTQLCLIFSIILLGFFGEPSLLRFGIVFSVIPFLLLFALNIKAFTKDYPDLIPNKHFWEYRFLKDIFGLGVKFFILQVSVLVLFSTDNYLITKLIGPEAVVPYNLAYKYFGIISSIQLIFLAPYWSAFTEAYTKRNIPWIKSTMKKLNFLTVGLLLSLVIMFFVAPYAYEFWIGIGVTVTRRIDGLMMLYFAIAVVYAPYNYFINGIGKINLHTVGFAISAMVNIPLSILLANNFGMGSEGVILATIICVSPYVALFPWQTRSLLAEIS
jgi:O-antigen/teichoic acid export membrane protein